MKNQVTLKDSQGQTIVIDLLTKFKNKTNSKDYIFYTDGKTTTNGIPLYVLDITENSMINDTDWQFLQKNVMANMINNQEIPDIEIGQANSTLDVPGYNNARPIAMTEAYLDGIRNYSSSHGFSVVAAPTNGDLLNNAFDVPNAQNAAAPQEPAVKFEGIPTTQFGEKVEPIDSQPATLEAVSTVPPLDTSVPPIPSVDPLTVEAPTQENTQPAGQVEPINQQEQPVLPEINVEPASTTVSDPNKVESTTPIIDSPFNVNPNGSRTNMFDEVSPSVEPSQASVADTPAVDTSAPSIPQETAPIAVNDTANQSTLNDLRIVELKAEKAYLNQRIELIDRELKLLAPEQKSVGDEPLEKTAADLFGPNGFDENKVLEMTPVPTFTTEQKIA